MQLRTDGVHVGGHTRPVIIPAWLVAAVTISLSILLAGFRLGAMVRDAALRLHWLEVRTCRIETRLGIDTWPGCPEAPSPD